MPLTWSTSSTDFDNTPEDRFCEFFVQSARVSKACRRPVWGSNNAHGYAFSADLGHGGDINFCVNFLMPLCCLSTALQRCFCGDCRSHRPIQKVVIPPQIVCSHQTCTWCCSHNKLGMLARYLFCSQVIAAFCGAILAPQVLHGSFLIS